MVAALKSSTLRIMLVDDHTLIRQSLAEILHRQSNIEVVGQAGDGVEALEMAERVHPDVVLMDITMPRLNGVEATRELKCRQPQVRVVGLSMHASPEMSGAMIGAGASAFLTKGCSIPSLLDAVRGSDTVEGVD